MPESAASCRGSLLHAGREHSVVPGVAACARLRLQARPGAPDGVGSGLGTAFLVEQGASSRSGEGSTRQPSAALAPAPPARGGGAGYGRARPAGAHTMAMPGAAR